jgi:hypothetical protein
MNVSFTPLEPSIPFADDSMTSGRREPFLTNPRRAGVLRPNRSGPPTESDEVLTKDTPSPAELLLGAIGA